MWEMGRGDAMQWDDLDGMRCNAPGQSVGTYLKQTVRGRLVATGCIIDERRLDRSLCGWRSRSHRDACLGCFVFLVHGCDAQSNTGAEQQSHRGQRCNTSRLSRGRLPIRQQVRREGSQHQQRKKKKKKKKKSSYPAKGLCSNDTMQ